MEKLRCRRVQLIRCSGGLALIPPSCTALQWLSCPIETEIREKQASTCSPCTVILMLAAVSSWCKARYLIICIAACRGEQLSISKGDASCKLYLLQLQLLVWSFKASQQLETLAGDNTFPCACVCASPAPACAWGHTAMGRVSSRAGSAIV